MATGKKPTAQQRARPQRDQGRTIGRRQIRWQVVILAVVATVLGGIIFAPLIPVGRYSGTGSSGFMLALRDMVITPHPYVGPNAFGLGDLPARNAPQDGVLALVGLVFPATWAVRALLSVGVILGSVGAAGLARRSAGGPTQPPPAVMVGCQAAAITLTLWNPFVAERLAQGQWSLVIAAWALPFIAHCSLGNRLGWTIAGLWCASLTPTGAILGGTVALVCLTGTRRWRELRIVAIAFIVMTLPWVVPGLLVLKQSEPPLPEHTVRAMVEAFAPGPEPYVGTLGALASLGGIWNAQVVPAGRQAGLGILGVVLTVFLIVSAGYAALAPRAAARRGGTATRARVPGALVLLAALGWGYACAAVVFPELIRGLIQVFPPAALGRDAQKTVALALPFLASACGSVGALAAAGTPKAKQRARLTALVGPLLVIVLSIGQVPDLAGHLRGLGPIPTMYSTQQVAGLRALPGDVFDPHARTVINHAGRVMIDPRAKDLPFVQPGELSVDGVPTDPYAQRFTQATQAYENDDRARLAQLGVGVVLEEPSGQNQNPAPTTLLIPEPATIKPWRTGLGVGLTLIWLLVPIAGAFGGRRRR